MCILVNAHALLGERAKLSVLSLCCALLFSEAFPMQFSGILLVI